MNSWLQFPYFRPGLPMFKARCSIDARRQCELTLTYSPSIIATRSCLPILFDDHTPPQVQKTVAL